MTESDEIQSLLPLNKCSFVFTAQYNPFTSPSLPGDALSQQSLPTAFLWAFQTNADPPARAAQERLLLGSRERVMAEPVSLADTSSALLCWRTNTLFFICKCMDFGGMW